MSKVIFLDYDGVVNTPMWNDEGTRCSFGYPHQGKVNNFQAVQWLSEFCQKFGFDIVVTSTWRMDPNYKECLINGGLRSGINILGRTEKLLDKTRGEEIQDYIEHHPEITEYFVIDDENDGMKIHGDRFIKTMTEVGFTEIEFMKMKKMMLF